jgi:hypothetical protein
VAGTLMLGIWPGPVSAFVGSVNRVGARLHRMAPRSRAFDRWILALILTLLAVAPNDRSDAREHAVFSQRGRLCSAAQSYVSPAGHPRPERLACSSGGRCPGDRRNVHSPKNILVASVGCWKPTGRARHVRSSCECLDET